MVISNITRPLYNYISCLVDVLMSFFFFVEKGVLVGDPIWNAENEEPDAGFDNTC